MGDQQQKQQNKRTGREWSMIEGKTNKRMPPTEGQGDDKQLGHSLSRCEIICESCSSCASTLSASSPRPVRSLSGNRTPHCWHDSSHRHSALLRKGASEGWAPKAMTRWRQKARCTTDNLTGNVTQDIYSSQTKDRLPWECTHASGTWRRWTPL